MMWVIHNVIVVWQCNSERKTNTFHFDRLCLISADRKCGNFSPNLPWAGFRLCIIYFNSASFNYTRFSIFMRVNLSKTILKWVVFFWDSKNKWQLSLVYPSSLMFGEANLLYGFILILITFNKNLTGASLFKT